MRLAICVMLATVGLAAAVQDGDYRVTIEKGRAARVLELTAANGWLAVAGLFWLHEGGNAAGSDASNPIRLPPGAPARLGTFQLTKGHVRFVAAPGVGVTAQGQPASTFEFDPEKEEKSSIAADDFIMFIIKRGDRLGVRLLDPKTISRSNFKGLRYFPLRTAYRVQGKFVPYSTAKMVPVPNVLGMTVPMESPGYVLFRLHGRQYRLEPVYETSKHEDLFFIFKDLTSRSDTYPAGRFLHTPLPVDGRVTIDFNNAYNPPCAFTAFATCPLPTKANQLPVRIEAGELRYP